MSSIALKTETGLNNEMILKDRSKSVAMTITDAISQSVTHTAMNLQASAIITATGSGHTARMISKYRPKAPIVAVTFTESVSRQLALVWGVHATVGLEANTTDEMLDIAVERGLSTNLFERGSQVVITAGVPIGESGTTNLLKVHVIGDIIAKGQGIGRRTAYGKVVIAKDAEQANSNISTGDILVTYGTDRDMMPAIEKAGGIITEEGGLTSHAAVVGLSLGIPVIVGVENVYDLIQDGKEYTMDGSKGDIYEGHASVL
jgi:pyruvate kinase